MPDWSQSMQQSYEYYIVDPVTWRDKRRVEHVKSCSINRDATSETLGSAIIDVGEPLGECYIRAYLITIQNGLKEKHPLATFLVQTPTSEFNGKSEIISLDAYTPLLELKENPPPLGFSLLEGDNIMEKARQLTREHMRAPVSGVDCNTLLTYDFVANTNDTWISFLSSLMMNAKYSYQLDEMGRVLFLPKQDTASLQPIWTYDSGNSSILYPEISVNRDLYEIPNVVEVVYSRGSGYLTATAINDDSNSPTSIVNRGRPITRRITDPDLSGSADQEYVQEYAELALRELSTLEYTVSYTHGYCPVRINDCVRLNYPEAGLVNIKAKVISQSIKCSLGCPVTEKAVFTAKLWG